MNLFTKLESTGLRLGRITFELRPKETSHEWKEK